MLLEIRDLCQEHDCLIIMLSALITNLCFLMTVSVTLAPLFYVTLGLDPRGQSLCHSGRKAPLCHPRALSFFVILVPERSEE